MAIRIKTQKLTKDAFAPYGDLIDTSGSPDKIINRGKCGRYHNKANLDFSDGQAGISLFKGEVEVLPLHVDMLERHPLGSQAFIPMTAAPFLVVVAQNVMGAPKDVQAFLTQPGQAINFYKGTWHGVLTPLSEPGLFAVVDRIGSGENLEEHWFKTAYVIE